MENTQETPAAVLDAEPAKAKNDTIETPMTLAEYATGILDLHQRVATSDRLSKQQGREAIASAIKAGEYLNAVKAMVGHGHWLKWLKENCTTVCPKTAKRYIKLAEKRHMSNLKDCASLRQAYIVVGALDGGNLEKNAEVKSAPQPNAGPVLNGNAGQNDGESPEIVLWKMKSRFAGFQNLYRNLVKAKPDLEDNLYDCCDPSLMPLPVLLDRWRFSMNDALAYFGLPEIQVDCVGCGHVKEPEERFGSIFPKTPEYADRLEWCDECVAYYALWVRRCEVCGAELFYGGDGDTTICLPPFFLNQHKSANCEPAVKKRGDDYFARFPNAEAITRYVDERHGKFWLCNCNK